MRNEGKSACNEAPVSRFLCGQYVCAALPPTGQKIQMKENKKKKKKEEYHRCVYRHVNRRPSWKAVNPQWPVHTRKSIGRESLSLSHLSFRESRFDSLLLLLLSIPDPWNTIPNPPPPSFSFFIFFIRRHPLSLCARWLVVGCPLLGTFFIDTFWLWSEWKRWNEEAQDEVKTKKKNDFYIFSLFHFQQVFFKMRVTLLDTKIPKSQWKRRIKNEKYENFHFDAIRSDGSTAEIKCSHP